MGGLIGGLGELDVLEEAPGLTHGYRVVKLEFGALRLQGRDDGQGGGFAHVVGVGFEGKPPNRQDLALEVPNRLLHLLNEELALVIVDVQNIREDAESVAAGFADLDQGRHILGKTASAKTQP